MALFTKVSKNEDSIMPQGSEEPQEEEVQEEQPVEITQEESVFEQVAANHNSIATARDDNDWLDKESAEGQLSVDIYQTKDNIVIKSTIAGVRPEDLDVSIDNDMITLRGARKQEEKIQEDDYFYQECYWGDFSRSVILPMEVVAEEAEALLKNGVLTLILPKARKNKSVAVKIKTE